MRGWSLVIAVGLAATAGVGPAVVSRLSHVGVHQGYAPEQPIAFSHKLHAGESQIPCLYCHASARTSRHAGIPPLNVCMNCHSLLTKQTVEIEKLKEAVQRKQAISWTKVHNLPDFVYFNHSQHVVTGGVPCGSCHGAVETMERIRQDAPLTMGWCLDCHRTGGHGRERPRLATVSRTHSDGQAPGLDCGKCHY